MVAKPYPLELVQNLTRHDGIRIVIRPIRPGDRQIEQDFVRKLSDESRYFRFFNSVQDLSERMLSRFTQIDYDKEMALVAVITENGHEVEIGVARYVINPDGKSCEFAIVIADVWQHKGIGSALMRSLLEAARARGLETMEGIVLASNHKMLSLMEALGFGIQPAADDPMVRHVVKKLTQQWPPAATGTIGEKT